VLGEDTPGSVDKLPGKGVDVMFERERYPNTG